MKNSDKPVGMMMMSTDKECPDRFEQREALGDAYWNDPRWKEVAKLRQEGKQSDANGLVFQIRGSWVD